MVYKFLWKDPDKVTVINSLKSGGLNPTDLETQIKAIRLSWIPRVLGERVGLQKYFTFHLKKYGRALLLKCNYGVRDLNLSLKRCFISSYLSGEQILEMLFLILIMPIM